MLSSETDRTTIMLHGRELSMVTVGSGPVLLLIHGMAGTLENWSDVIEPLARHHTVVAPDLPGHGGSAPGAGDYSLGGLAAGLRDLWPRSATSARRWSDTRWAAGSPCSSATSSRRSRSV